MNADARQAPANISADRIAQLEDMGRQARREGRSRMPSLFPGVERAAYQRGWDQEQATQATILAPKPRA